MRAIFFVSKLSKIDVDFKNGAKIFEKKHLLLR